MTETVRWCSLFCTGNEAVGELSVPLNDTESASIPVCDECMEEVKKDPQGALAYIVGPVVASNDQQH